MPLLSLTRGPLPSAAQAAQLTWFQEQNHWGHFRSMRVQVDAEALGLSAEKPVHAEACFPPRGKRCLCTAARCSSGHVALHGPHRPGHHSAAQQKPTMSKS